MENPRPWLRYVDASDLDNSTLKFDGMAVDSPTGEQLGDVDGVIVDVSSGRPYYVVVDGGGWFKSKYFLLPIGHVSLSGPQDRLVADVGKERIERYPGFDRGAFEKLSDDELDRMAGQIADACCPVTVVSIETTRTPWTTRAHYTSPAWWRTDYYRGELPVSSSSKVAGTSMPPSTSSADAGVRERVVAQDGEASPHPGGRAQPGDVIGIETGGEETHIGETSDDENERRRNAEKAGAKRARE